MNRTKTQVLRDALTAARCTRSFYKELGVASTQNVRNPYPLRVLVAQCLAVLPCPTDTVMLNAKVSTTVNGQKFVKHIHVNQTAKDIIPASVWLQQSKTSRQVEDDLRAKGYIVTRGSVASALSACRRIGLVTFVRSPKTGHIGKRPSLYFVHQKNFAQV